MKPTVAVLYSDAAAAALVDALKHWRSSYAPSVAYDELMANYVSLCKTQTTIYPAGRTTIHVRIEGRRQRDSDDYWYEASLVAGQLRLEGIS